MQFAINQLVDGFFGCSAYGKSPTWQRRGQPMQALAGHVRPQDIGISNHTRNQASEMMGDDGSMGAPLLIGALTWSMLKSWSLGQELGGRWSFLLFRIHQLECSRKVGPHRILLVNPPIGVSLKGYQNRLLQMVEVPLTALDMAQRKRTSLCPRPQFTSFHIKQ